ncbi:MAG: hypothetical protein ACXWQ8_06260 [Ktedonobacterales bacterium]
MSQEHMTLLTDRASATAGVLERAHPALPQADGVASALPLR